MNLCTTFFSSIYKKIHKISTILSDGIYRLTFNLAFGYLVSPHAYSGFPVVSETGRTLIPAGLSVPTIPENVTFLLIGENSVQPRAVRSTDSRLWGQKQIYNIKGYLGFQRIGLNGSTCFGSNWRLATLLAF